MGTVRLDIFDCSSRFGVLWTTTFITFISCNFIKNSTILINVNMIKRHIQEETDNVDADEEGIHPEEAVINSSCLILDHANDSWSNDKANVLNGCSNSESCSDTSWRNHVWD